MLTKLVNKPETKWAFYIGAPYGTSLCQVGDPKEQDGSYIIASERIKKNLLKKGGKTPHETYLETS